MQRKRPEYVPHANHVSKALANSLTTNDDNTNRFTSQHIPQTTTKISNTKKPRRTVKELRRLISKRKHIKNPLKRKSVLKRLRKELARLKRKMVSLFYDNI